MGERVSPPITISHLFHTSLKSIPSLVATLMRKLISSLEPLATITLLFILAAKAFGSLPLFVRMIRHSAAKPAVTGAALLFLHLVRTEPALYPRSSAMCLSDLLSRSCKAVMVFKELLFVIVADMIFLPCVV